MEDFARISAVTISCDIKHADELEEAPAGPLLGLLNEDSFPYAIDGESGPGRETVPTLERMTKLNQENGDIAEEQQVDMANYDAYVISMMTKMDKLQAQLAEAREYVNSIDSNTEWIFDVKDCLQAILENK